MADKIALWIVLGVILIGSTAIAVGLFKAWKYATRKIRNATAEAEAAEWSARRAQVEAHRDGLVARFGAENADRLLRREIWQGQTTEMLIEARGAPANIDERVTAKMTRHVYKYDQQGKNRYRLRVTLENGVVVGWEEKS
jgi:hypothetical protein